MVISYSQKIPNLGLAAGIYSAWTSDRPANPMTDATYNPPNDPGDEDDDIDDEDDDEESQHTKPLRYGSRKWSAPQSSPTPSVRSRCRCLELQGRKQKHSTCLSEGDNS